MKRSANADELLTKVELAVLAERNLAQLEAEIRRDLDHSGAFRIEPPPGLKPGTLEYE
jgi:hypothetical protein